MKLTMDNGRRILVALGWISAGYLAGEIWFEPQPLQRLLVSWLGFSVLMFGLLLVFTPPVDRRGDQRGYIKRAIVGLVLIVACLTVRYWPPIRGFNPENAAAPPVQTTAHG